MKSVLEPRAGGVSPCGKKHSTTEVAVENPVPVRCASPESERFDPESARAVVASWIQEFHADIYRFSYWISGCPNSAEDVTQETFLRAFHAAQKGNGPREEDKTKSWLLTIARNEFSRHAKRQNRILANSEITEDTVQIENTTATEENREWLRNGLQELSENYRAILLMYYFEEQSYAEIAAALDIPIGTVMSRLSRAKKSLKSQLTRFEQETIPPDH